MAVGTIQPIALSHLAQECLSLVISRRCHSALYRCLAHNFLPEGSTALSLAFNSYLSARGAGLEGHCEREDHQLPNRCYAELNSSLEFIPIKSLAATGSDEHGSYAAHSRFPSPDRGHPPSTDGSGLSRCDSASRYC